MVIPAVTVPGAFVKGDAAPLLFGAIVTVMPTLMPPRFDCELRMALECCLFAIVNRDAALMLPRTMLLIRMQHDRS